MKNSLKLLVAAFIAAFVTLTSVKAATQGRVQAIISLSSSSPLEAMIPVTNTTNGQYLGLPVLVFDVHAQNDTLHLRTINVSVMTNGIGSVQAAYLYQGSTQVASASVSNGVASFNNIHNGTVGATIAVDTTLSYVVKVDATGVIKGSLDIVAGTGPAQMILSSKDSMVSVGGMAQGNSQTVISSGPLFTIVGTPTITKTNHSSGGGTDVKYLYTATFNVNVMAIGTDVLLGLPASPTFAAFGSPSTNFSLAQVWENGVASITKSVTASYSSPTGTAVTNNVFIVQRNQSVTVPVTYSFIVTNQAASSFFVQIQGINWAAKNGLAGPATFMSNQPAWRTPSI